MACAGCSKKLGTRFFKLDSRYYHHDCFVCHTCGGSLSSGYFESGGDIYCQSHVPNTYGTTPRATVGGKGSAFVDPDQSTETKSCSVCRGFLKTDPYVVVEDELVHKKCFHCTGCGKPLSKQPYFYHGPGVFLCEKDNRWASGHDDSDWICGTCKKPIKDSVIVARGIKFHPDCVKCSTKGCKEPGKYISMNDNYCATHMPVGAEMSHRIERTSDVDESAPPTQKASRAFAKMDTYQMGPREQKEKMDYSNPKKETTKPSNPFASRDGAIAPLPDQPTALPYVSTRPAGFVPAPVVARKVAPKKYAEPEPEAEDESEPEPVPTKPAKKKQQAEPDEEETQIGKVTYKPSVSERPKEEKAKENIADLLAEDDDDKPVKRGTPAAARKQAEAAYDAKEKLRARLKDEPKAKGKPTYTVTVNPDGTPKTAQDLLEARQKEAEKKEKRQKEKADKERRKQLKEKLKAQQEAESQRKGKLTGSGAKIKKKKEDDEPDSEEEPAEEPAED